MKKLSAILKIIFGYGIMICLMAGGLTFLGYVIALVFGGNIASSICSFLSDTFIPILVYCTSTLVLVGLLAMYFNGEFALTVSKK